jgi:hypothetical protein
MIQFSEIAQITIAFSIVVVWVLRFDNIVNEFKIYRIPNLIRNFIGASKISLATLLVAGIWYPGLVQVPALIMAFLMICAQITHVRAKSPAVKFLPSFALLLLSLFVAGVNSGIIA